MGEANRRKVARSAVAAIEVAAAAALLDQDQVREGRVSVIRLLAKVRGGARALSASEFMKDATRHRSELDGWQNAFACAVAVFEHLEPGHDLTPEEEDEGRAGAAIVIEAAGQYAVKTLRLGCSRSSTIGFRIARASMLESLEGMAAVWARAERAIGHALRPFPFSALIAMLRDVTTSQSRVLAELDRVVTPPAELKGKDRG